MDPSARPTIEEVLAHPWHTQTSIRRDDVDEEDRRVRFGGEDEDHDIPSDEDEAISEGEEGEPVPKWKRNLSERAQKSTSLS